MTPTPQPDAARTLQHLADLVERTKDLDYDPSQCDGAWVCGDHGLPECTQGACESLPWPEPNEDSVLAAFTTWADEEFRRIVAPYDNGRVPEMPEDAFRTYTVSEWPLGPLLAAVRPPQQQA